MAFFLLTNAGVVLQGIKGNLKQSQGMRELIRFRGQDEANLLVLGHLHQYDKTLGG